MKPRSRAVTVGRNLRRYLGALLAVGFGVSWWSFMPPAAAATKPRSAQARRAPHAVAVRVTSVPAPTFTPPHPEVIPVVAPPVDPPKPQPHHRPKPRPVKRPRPPVVHPPIVEPVDEPDLPPIITRSS